MGRFIRKTYIKLIGEIIVFNVVSDHFGLAFKMKSLSLFGISAKLLGIIFRKNIKIINKIIKK